MARAGGRAISGRTALVTGGGRGLGRAIALRLAVEGVAVAVAGRATEPLEHTVAEIRALGADGLAVPCDIADPAAVDELRDRVLAWRSPVTVLVNNAGIPGPTAALVDIAPEQWDDVMAVNVRGVYLCCRAFAPAMIEHGAGDVINVASVSGKRPLPRRTPYCASKMAVIGLTATLAAELGPSGVRVNSISPGPVRGDRMAGVFEREARATGGSIADAEQAFVSRAALGRLVEEDEVADGVVALLRIGGITAADLDLSAGMVAR